LQATFTVNYGGVYDFGTFSLAPFGFPSSFPILSAVQAMAQACRRLHSGPGESERFFFQ